MLAAGGTGGHLFPAFALAEELGRRGIPVELATDMRGDRYGTGFPARKVHRIHSATLGGRSPVAVAKTGWTLTRGVREAFGIIGESQPAVIVGFGGYPSFPPLLAGKLRGVPTLLHEQNAVLGRANRMLAKRVDLIATSFAKVGMLEAALESRTRFTGNPVRQAVIDCATQAYRAPRGDGPLALLVFGGSQGASFFSDAVPPALARLSPGLRTRLDVVQQAREDDVERTRALYAAAGIKAEVAPFFRDLPARMANAQLVIARAGASTVAEVCAIGRPSILVPLPHALDNDQLRNATTVAESGGGLAIAQNDLSVERLAAEIERLAGAPDELDRLAAAAKALGRPDAVVLLADLVVELGYRG